MASKVVKIRSWEEEHGDYRCGGTVIEHEKYYVCSNCGNTVNDNSKFCSHCGVSLNDVVDYRKKEIKKRITKCKSERTKLVKSVTPENFDSITEKIHKVEKRLKFYQEGLNDWERYSRGSLPSVLDVLD